MEEEYNEENDYWNDVIEEEDEDMWEDDTEEREREYREMQGF